MARFDWYQATVDAPPMAVLEPLLDELPGAVGYDRERGRFGYQGSFIVRDAEGSALATVLHGGRNGPPNAFASGDRAPDFAAIVRAHWPEAHRVTRLDSAQDVPCSFAELHPQLRALAASWKLKGRTVVPDNPDDGSTYYMGSTASRNALRVYEKGKQLRATGQDVPAGALDLVRFEAQLRPTKEGRLTASLLSPDEAWGATFWLRHVARAYLGSDPGRHHMQFRLLTDYERRSRAMLAQYGSHLVEMHRRLGSWEAVGLHLGASLSEE